MSKLNQIERTIQELEGGKFQKLANAYLKTMGYEQLNAIGSVIGSDKTKDGTPDTLIALPNGKYKFVEHTTKQEGLEKKIREDLDKCFDQNKTGIPLQNIEQVIICFTSKKLSSKDENDLRQFCEKKGVNLKLFGIDSIALDLYQKYPNLARDFLEIDIDTGQILSPKDFVESYNKNKMTTPLDLSFHYREKELENVVTNLENNNLIILSGVAGVGKSRLALEACNKFQKEHKDYKVFCILQRGRDIWEDLKTYFSKSGKFLIFVDDANRINQFEYVVDLLLHQREEQHIKVIATVRGYALSKILETSKALGEPTLIEVEPFTDKQIEGLVKAEYSIDHYLALDRIVELSQGNPRLAVMGAKLAKEENNLQSIANIESLYETYFSSIRKDWQETGIDINELLKVAGIIFFLNSVDYTNKDMMNLIEEAFNISSNEFWRVANKLYQIEIVDIYENEVVKVSDQVLATYIFYLATFKKRVLNFGILLNHFFPRFCHRIIDSMNPVLDAFNDEYIIEIIQPYVEQFWSQLERNENTDDPLKLLELFWFVKPTDCLIWIQNYIDQMQVEEADITELNFKETRNAIPSPSLLSVLRLFQNTNKKEAEIALTLILNYLEKKPGEVSYIIHILIEDYGFHHTSELTGFEIQHAVIDTLWQYAKQGNLLFSHTFLAIAKDYLGTHFNKRDLSASNTIKFWKFNLVHTEKLIDLRRKIWQGLSDLYQTQNVQDSVLSLIYHYSISPDYTSDPEIIKQDQENLLPFLQAVLEPNNYWHCLVLNNYLDLLEKHGLEVQQGLRQQFSNKTYRLSKVLLWNWREEFEFNSSCEELNLEDLGLDSSPETYEQYKQKQLAEFTKNYTFDDYIHFFNACIEIYESPDIIERKNSLQQGVLNALLLLADKDASLFKDVLSYYLTTLGEMFELSHTPFACNLVKKLIDQQGADNIWQLLSEPEYPTKTKWLFYFYQVLPEESVSQEKLNNLYDLYKEAKRKDLPQGSWDFLLKYLSIDSSVITGVTAKILAKAQSEPNYATALKMLFSPYTKVGQRITEFFTQDEDSLNLLKQAYFAAQKIDRCHDYEGKIFNCLLDADFNFINEYINWIYENSGSFKPSLSDDQKDYSFIWMRSDYAKVMNQATETIYTREQKVGIFELSYLRVFFMMEKENKLWEKVISRQDTLLLNLIRERHNESEFMKFLSSLIRKLPKERCFQFVECFIQYNKNLEDFKQLVTKLRPNFASGSWVPVLERYQKFLESLLPLINSLTNPLELLPYRKYIEDIIQDIQNIIEQEKKRNFLET